MEDANQCASPPSGGSQSLEDEDVYHRKYPSHCHMHQEAIEPGAVAIGSKHCAQHVGKIDASESKPLGSGADRGQNNGREKAPQYPASPIHEITSRLPD